MAGFPPEWADALGTSLKGLGAAAALNGMAGMTALRFQAHFYPTRNLFDRILACFLIYIATIVGWLTLLGAMGLLDLPEALVVFAFFTAAIFLLGRALEPPVEEVSWKGDKTGADWVRRFFSRMDPEFRLFFMLLLPFLAAHALWAVINPPPPGGDGYIYHLFFPAVWRQLGRIDVVDIPFGTQAASYYPCDMELVFLWIMAPFRSDFLVNTAQLPFLAACGALIYRMARRMGTGQPAAAVAGLTAVLWPGFIQQSAVARVDLAFACFFLYAVHGMQEYAQTRRNVPVFFSGLAAGLFVGTKIVGLLFAPLLVLPFLAAICLLEKSAREAAGKLARFLVPAAAMCGFWYARNWIVAGNPVYPLDVNLFGRDIFPGAYGSGSMKAFHAEGPAELGKIFNLFLGLGPSLALGAFYTLGWAALLRKRKPAPFELFVGLAPLAYAALFWFVNPHNNLTNGRFLFPAFLLAALHGAKALDGRGKVARALRAAALLSAVAGTAQHPNLVREAGIMAAALFGAADARFTGSAAACWLVLGALALFVWTLLTRVEGSWKGRARLLPLAFFLALSAAAISAHAWCGGAKPNFFMGFPEGEAWAMFEKNVPGAATVAYAGTDRPYGLIGHGLDHRLVYVNVDQRPGWKFHDYHRHILETGGLLESSERPQYHRRFARFEYWLSNMRDSGAEWLFVAKPDVVQSGFMTLNRRGFPIEEDWTRKRPDLFRLKFENDAARIYQVVMPGEANGRREAENDGAAAGGPQ